MKGRIVTDDVQELRERADIVEFISGYMKLKRAGRVFKGLCCFHQEKTPSFTVDPSKGLYYCHGCGNGGDIFRFIQQVEGLTFSEAAQRLADRVGLNLRHEGPSDQSDGQRSGLLAVCRAAAAYFTELLETGGEAGSARRYLERRGFDRRDAQVWGLGYAPSGRDTLYRHLLGRKFTSKQIVDAGLAKVVGEGEHRDLFRNRVIFPVSNLTGQVVAFGARALGDEQPKYINSPETPIYSKGKILFGLDRAKAEMVRSGEAVVTEGYTDVIALHKVGLTNAVATCGTALGEDHFGLIKRFCERAVLAFDADAAGSVASERSFGIHARVGLEVLVTPLPAGKDPADVALAEGGDAVRSILGKAIPLMRFVLEREISRHSLETPEGKARAVRSAAHLLSWEPNRVARSEHGFWVASRIGVAPEQVQLEISETGNSERKGRPAAGKTRLPGHVKVEREALAILLDSNSSLNGAMELLTPHHFTQPEHRAVYEALVDLGKSTGRSSVMDYLPDDDSKRFVAELVLAPVLTEDRQEVFFRLEEFRIRRQIEALRAKLERLDPRDDAAGYDALFEELMRLDVERRRFDDR
jgi:DNA primase